MIRKGKEELVEVVCEWTLGFQAGGEKFFPTEGATQVATVMYGKAGHIPGGPRSHHC